MSTAKPSAMEEWTEDTVIALLGDTNGGCQRVADAVNAIRKRYETSIIVQERALLQQQLAEAKKDAERLADAIHGALYHLGDDTRLDCDPTECRRILEQAIDAARKEGK